MEIVNGRTVKLEISVEAWLADAWHENGKTETISEATKTSDSDDSNIVKSKISHCDQQDEGKIISARLIAVAKCVP